MNRPIHLWFRRFLAALVGRVLVLPASGAVLRFAFIGESLFLFAFGALISTGQTATAAPFFDGAQDAKSRTVMRQAGLDIEKYRKGSFTLELVDAGGNPVALLDSRGSMGNMMSWSPAIGLFWWISPSTIPRKWC